MGQFGKLLYPFQSTGLIRIRYCPSAIAVFRCFINIQKDANERKTDSSRTYEYCNLCTELAVCFVYVDTNNSVCSW